MEPSPPSRPVFRIMVFVKIKTTRDKDLEMLAEGRNKVRDKKTLQRLLDKVYRQSKDPKLESVRKGLIEAHKRHDLVEVEKLERIIKSITQ